MNYSLPFLYEYHNLAIVNEPHLGYESDLVTQWLELKPGTILKDVKGGTIIVINPGQRNRHEGPDIRNATLMINGRYCQGQVECHLDTKSWKGHRHHQDPAYAHVILHVVRRAQRDALSGLRTVILPIVEKGKSQSCSVSHLTISSKGISVIQDLAFRRWQQHVKRFLTAVDQKQPLPITLVGAAFRMLGAGGNEEAFVSLANLLDLQVINSLTPDAALWYLDNLSKHLHVSWHQCGLRPFHHPQRRFPLAVSLAQFVDDPILNQPSYPHPFVSRFEQYFTPVSGPGIRTELLGNVFYPYFAARSLIHYDHHIFFAWRNDWLELTLPYSYGKYVRQFRNVFCHQDLRSFSILQGLKELDRTFCSRRLCPVCPLKEMNGNSF